jgi:hypothetical protein
LVSQVQMSVMAKITGPMRFDLWDGESLDAARLRDVVYYSSAGFSYRQARELERVPVQHGSAV